MADTKTDELDKIIDCLYRIDKYDRLHFGWICLRSEIWKELPKDVAQFTSQFLSSEPKLMLFIDKPIIIKINDDDTDWSNTIWKLIISSFWHQIRENGIAIQSIIYENKQYFQRTNTYYTRPDHLKNKYEYDKDIECQGYDGWDTRCDGSWQIKPTDPDNVTYCYEDIDYLSDKKPVFTDKEDDNHWYSKKAKQELGIKGMYIIDKLRKIMSRFKLKNIFIGEEYNRGYDIKFINPMGINPDHRGADHCKIYLHCYQNQLIKSKQSVSFRNLIDIYFRSKSHKFDLWYELYSDCKVEMKYLQNENNKKVGNGKYLLITFSYDHGS